VDDWHHQHTRFRGVLTWSYPELTLRKATAETLAVDVTASEEPFQDHAGSSGSGCLLTATGTGEHFGSFLDTAAKLNTMFTNLGWIEDQAYLADGPTGTATAHRKDSMLAMVAAGWSPAPDVECPQDQPISGCEVPPTKQLFTITVRIGQAQRG
jgi:hypothetical protein